MSLQLALIVKRIENLLIKAEEFHLPSQRQLQQSEKEIELIVIDVAETEIERPQKKQKDYYSGKQKCHTFKMQRIIARKTREIICTAFGKGRRHDFFVFQKSQVNIKQEIKLIADQGYQGIHHHHQASIIPDKKTKKTPLTPEQKASNHQQSKVRVVVENVIRCLKIFRILSSRYRSKRKRFGLRVNLIAGLYNYELKLAT